MVPQWIIEKKRDGEELSKQELAYFLNGYTCGDIPDYQMSAMAMAIYFQGMSLDETVNATEIMMNSGDLLDTSTLSQPTADKHSTGGVGDKVSLILAPLAACCGVAVPMISGRGLGITGGTLDKLESIPGYRTDLTVREFIDTLQKCGCSIIGQTQQLAPADKKLYALRDVTATVPSIPLIVASIMSKKLAAGIDALVIDVKWGEGAFMKSTEKANELARTLVEVGQRLGTRMGALVTDMNQPLGKAVGNALEVIESVECLAGRGPDDVMKVTMALCAQMLVLTNRCETKVDALETVQEKIATGEALATFMEMVERHGGDVTVLEDYSRFDQARILHDVVAPSDGLVHEVNANSLGRGCNVLGAGRQKTHDAIDSSVGITDLAKIGDRVAKGDRLATVHANDNHRLHVALTYIQEAFILSEGDVSTTSLINDSLPFTKETNHEG